MPMTVDAATGGECVTTTPALLPTPWCTLAAPLEEVVGFMKPGCRLLLTGLLALAVDGAVDGRVRVVVVVVEAAAVVEAVEEGRWGCGRWVTITPALGRSDDTDALATALALLEDSLSAAGGLWDDVAATKIGAEGRGEDAVWCADTLRR